MVVATVSTATPTSGAPWTTTSTAPASPTSTLPTPPSGASAAPPVPPPATLNPPVVPASGSAYLGAFVDPSGLALSGIAPLGGTGGVAAELDALPGVEQGLSRPLSIVEVDQGWSEPVDTAQLGQVEATGAIPMITWDCGDTDANVAAGADDTLITRFGHELNAFGAPVLVRWFPDPNAPNATAPGVPGCRRGARLRRGLPARPAALGGRRRLKRRDRLVHRHLAGLPVRMGRLLPRRHQCRLDRRRRPQPVRWSPRSGRPDHCLRFVVLDVLHLREATADLEHRGPIRVPGPVPHQVATDLPTPYPLVKALVYFDAP